MSGNTKKAKGCFFWGCLTLAILFVAGGGCIGFVLYRAHGFLKTYTSEVPPDVPVQQVNSDRLTMVTQEIEAFQAAVENDQPAQLSLSDDDLNMLIAEVPELAGNLYIDIEDDRINVTGGLPLDNILGFKGRYLNGTFSSRFSIEEGQVSIDLESFSIDDIDKVIPPELQQILVEEMQKEEFVDRVLANEPELEQMVNQIESLYFENGNVIINH